MSQPRFAQHPIALLMIFALFAAVLLLGVRDDSTTQETSQPVVSGEVPGAATGLPVIDPEHERTEPLLPRPGRVRNPITWGQLNTITAGNADGLMVDLGDEALSGAIFSGPYPHEYGRSADELGQADYDYSAFRLYSPLREGAGTIPVVKYFSAKYNSNGWPAGQCDDPADCPSATVSYRLNLLTIEDDMPVDIGFYESRAGFERSGEGAFAPATTINEGPFVTGVKSDDHTTVEIAFETDQACRGHVDVRELSDRFGEKGKRTRHLVAVSGLAADNLYHYQVQCGDARSGVYHFRTAPEPTSYPRNDGKITVVFASDSREGAGGGERRFMGTNIKVVKEIANRAYHRDHADLVIFGGDLINGYTSEVEDFRLQLKAFKQGWEGLWRHIPLYPAMGNHESLLNVYDDGSHYGLSLDKWPYETSSAEALFATEFYNPANGPVPSDSRRPPYSENVYSFRYGPALFVAFNNNYWWTTNEHVPEFGGSPEGYIMEDQLSWIERTLEDAEASADVSYIFLYAQEPVYPNGGHVKDAMWWRGNNNVRAYTKNAMGETVAADAGVIEVRNRFWKAVAGSSKVAAVMTGDEHGYHSMVVDSSTPVGIMSDDRNGDGVIDWKGDEPASPNPDFEHATWHITSGNAGAPWYAKEPTPWSDQVALFSSQIGYMLLDITADGVEMTAYSLEGGIIQHVDDLMAVKRTDRGSVAALD